MLDARVTCRDCDLWRGKIGVSNRWIIEGMEESEWYDVPTCRLRHGHDPEIKRHCDYYIKTRRKRMNYPTLEQVEKAGREQLARWYRFLPSPGTCAIGASAAKFEHALQREKEVMDLICSRFAEMGGFSPSLSKQVGWEK